MIVTKREILVSIIIGCLLLILGLFISYKIEDIRISEREKYNKALKINNNETMFKYAIDTNVGNIIVYDELKVTKGVNSEWLVKDYMYIEKITQRYTTHYRTVCSGSGEHRHCHRKTYHTWDTINRDKCNTDKVIFGGITFHFNDFENYPTYRLELDKSTVVSSVASKIKNNYIYGEDRFFTRVGDKRYYYKVVDKTFKTTVFGSTKDKKFTDNNRLVINTMTIKEFMESKRNSFVGYKVLFWFIYLMLSGIVIYGYVYLDNDYLEN